VRGLIRGSLEGVTENVPGELYVACIGGTIVCEVVVA